MPPIPKPSKFQAEEAARVTRLNTILRPPRSSDAESGRPANVSQYLRELDEYYRRMGSSNNG